MRLDVGKILDFVKPSLSEKILFTFFLIISSFIEVFTIMLLPLIGSILTTDGDFISIRALNIDIQKKYILYLIISMFIIRAIAQVSYQALIIDYVSKVQGSVQKNFISLIYKANYNAITFLDFGVIKKICNVSIPKIINECVYVILRLFFDLVSLLSICLVIFILIGFNASALILFFCFLAFVMMKFFNRPIRKSGTLMLDSQNKIFSILDNFLSGIEYIKVTRTFRHFESHLDNNINDFRVSGKIYYTILALPRYIIELLFVVSICVFILFSLDSNNIVEMSGIFAALVYAGFRLIPIFSNITTNLATLKHSQPLLDEFFSNSRFLNNSISIKEKVLLSEVNSIDTSEIIVKYVDKEIVFSPISIVRGQIACIHGPSGSGKSTLIRVLTGLIMPHQGYIEINGNRVSDFTIEASYVSQDCFLLPASLKENLTFGLKVFDKLLYEKIISTLGLEEFDTASFAINSTYSNVSGGQKQRISLARALLSDKDVVILDEPTSALDASNRDKFIELLKELSKTKIVFIITHDREIFNIFDMSIEVG